MSLQSFKSQSHLACLLTYSYHQISPRIYLCALTSKNLRPSGLALCPKNVNVQETDYRLTYNNIPKIFSFIGGFIMWFHHRPGKRRLLRPFLRPAISAAAEQARGVCPRHVWLNDGAQDPAAAGGYEIHTRRSEPRRLLQYRRVLVLC